MQLFDGCFEAVINKYVTQALQLPFCSYIVELLTDQGVN